MAKKPDLTKADGITADVVVELSQFYSSNELRSVQSKFTGRSVIEALQRDPDQEVLIQRLLSRRSLTH